MVAKMKKEREKEEPHREAQSGKQEDMARHSRHSHRRYGDTCDPGHTASGNGI